MRVKKSFWQTGVGMVNTGRGRGKPAVNQSFHALPGDITRLAASAGCPVLRVVGLCEGRDSMLCTSYPLVRSVQSENP